VIVGVLSDDDDASSQSASDAESLSPIPPPVQNTFKRNAHVNYFKRCLRALPSAAQEHDSNRQVTNLSVSSPVLAYIDIRSSQGHPRDLKTTLIKCRMTIAYFCISGLDLLDALKEIDQEQKDGWVSWIWSLQACRWRKGAIAGQL
jgi:geranylgeranyl transferase type-1 subunit beta